MNRSSLTFVVRWLIAATVLMPVVGRSHAGPRVVAYFVEWGIYTRNYQPINVPAHMITHLNYAFLNPVYDSASGTARLEFHDEFAALELLYPEEVPGVGFHGILNQLLLLKQRYPHVKTFVSIGGWTLSDHFSDIAASASGRTSFADVCANFVATYGFDGVDLDWEYPVQGGEPGLKHRPEDADNLLLLLAELRTRLDSQAVSDSKEYLLTIAASAGFNTLTSRFRLPEICDYVDWINMIAYDLGGPWDPLTTHQAPLFANPTSPFPGFNVDTSVRTYLTNGVPPEQLVVGIPFYGMSYDNVPPDNDGLFQMHTGPTAEGTWGPGVFEYRDLRDGIQGHDYLSDDSGYEKHRDPISQVPFLYGAVDQVMITYEDPLSAAAKASYVTDLGLGGIMIWSLDMDTSDAALLRTVYGNLYPTEISRDVPPGSGAPAVRVQWQAWEGQHYILEQATGLNTGNWQSATGLVDAVGRPLQTVTGSNVRVSVFDPHAGERGTSFYRPRHFAPPGP